MSSLSVGGLVSGLDTNTMIESLVEIEMTRVNRVLAQQKKVQDQSTAYNELVTRINALGTKATELAKLSTFNLFSASSNDEDLATVKGADNGSSGNFDVVVNQLATSQKVASKSYATTNASLGFSGSFEISTTSAYQKNNPTKTTVQVDIKPGDALKDIVNKINSAEGSGVKASILSLSNGENRLVLTAAEEGSDSFFMRDIDGSILTDELEVLSSQQSARTEFNFVTLDGFAAKGSTKFSEIFTSIGGNNLDSGDSINITGVNGHGQAVNANFVIDPENTTMDDFLAAIRNAFGPDTQVNINKSGEITLTNTGDGVEEISMDLSFVDQGAASTLQLGGTKAQNSFNNLINEGTKAFYLLDGMAVSSQSNTDTKTVVGAEITLKKADPEKVVKLSLEVDKDGIKNKIQEFLNEYNSVLKFIKEKTSVEVSEDGKDVKKGVLAGETKVSTLKRQLQNIMTSSVKELEGKTQYTSLASIGILSNKSTGALEIDDKIFQKALDGDLDGVKMLFAATGFSDNPEHELGRFDKNTKAGVYSINADTGDFDTDATAGTNYHSGNRTSDSLTSSQGDSKGLSITAAVGSGSGVFTFSRGLASQLQMFIDQANDYVDGSFKVTKETYQSRIKDFDKRIVRLEDQVAAYRSRLISQFTSLEQTMQRLQSQNSAFLSQLG